MRLLINTSTLSSTGVTQVAVSFINECKNFRENTYIVLLSNTVGDQLSIKDFPENFIFILLNCPAQRFIQLFFGLLKLKKLEKKYSADCVFSVFGPSYWTPKSPHLQGYAFPHYIYPESPLFNKLTLYAKYKIRIKKQIHKYLLRKNGKYFVCETEDVSQKASTFLEYPRTNFFTVSNTCNNYFNDYQPKLEKILPMPISGEFRLLCLCSFVPHKNLLILNELIPLLIIKLESFNFKFILTIDQNAFQSNFSSVAKKHIINLGRMKVSDCPQLYYETDALFLPTLMECFSANYVEAMKMNKPIITSNLSFATSVCKDAAIYFDPQNVIDIAEKIILLYNSDNQRNNLIEAGKLQLKTFLNSYERTEQYLKICNYIINE